MFCGLQFHCSRVLKPWQMSRIGSYIAAILKKFRDEKCTEMGRHVSLGRMRRPMHCLSVIQRVDCCAD